MNKQTKEMNEFVEWMLDEMNVVDIEDMGALVDKVKEGMISSYRAGWKAAERDLGVA